MRSKEDKPSANWPATIAVIIISTFILAILWFLKEPDFEPLLVLLPLIGSAIIFFGLRNPESQKRFDQVLAGLILIFATFVGFFLFFSKPAEPTDIEKIFESLVTTRIALEATQSALATEIADGNVESIATATANAQQLIDSNTQFSEFSTAQPTFVATVFPRLESNLSGLSLINSDDFSSPESGWDAYFDGQNLTGYENNNYFIEAKEFLFFMSVWGAGGRYTDGAFQTTILGPLSSDKVYTQGIGIGWTPDWNNQVYAVAITSSQLCTVFQSRINNEGVQVWTKRSSGKIENFDENATQYELTLIVNNQILTAYVDGELCLEYEMKDYVGGKVGVVAESASDGEKAIFDDFKIFEDR